ncbi:MAG: glycosyltransferase [Opitutales bacterium]|jgi:glycosyltransferase involved in cell wall biosynthesis
MRLLVLDEAWQAIGGVDTFRRFLLPALAARVENLWWACPSRLHPRRLAPASANLGNLETLDTFPPTYSLGGLAAAVLRRLPRNWAPAWRERAQNAVSRRHLRNLVRRLGITHLLEISVFRHFFPKLGIPVVGLIHDLDYPNCGHSPIDEVFRDWLRHADRIRAASTLTRTDLLKLLPEAAARVEVIAQPSPAPPNPPPTRLCNSWSRPEPVLYYPGVFTPRKNQAVLLAALTQVTARGIPFHCYLSGNGTDLMFADQPFADAATEAAHQACLRWREPLRNRVTALGSRSWSDVEQLFAAANLIVLPSRYEGFGLPMSEALRRGRPVVASRIPTFEEQAMLYRAHEQIRWFPPDDSNALAATLADILTGAAPFPPFPADLQARLASWTWDAFAERVITVLQDPSCPNPSIR